MDIRLVPAAVVSVSAALLVPALPFGLARGLPVLMMTCAVLATAAAVGSARSRTLARSALQTAASLTAVALWIGGAVAAQAVADRAEARSVGWETAVATGQTLRMAGTALAPPVHSPGRFADRWHVRVEVSGFGHPPSSPPHGSEVQVAGAAAWSEIRPGESVCFVSDLESSGGTVFARARTGPQAGACQEDSTVQAAPTGRERLREGLRRGSAGTVGSAPQLLPGLILGDRSVQSPELNSAMKDSGLSHLSAVSGANCTLIAGAVTMGLRTLRVRRPVVLTAVLAVLVVFVIVVGMEPSVIRAAVMGGIGAAAVFFGRGHQALPLLSLAVCVLLFWDPALADEAAFQLSVCATAGIVLGARPLEQWLTAAGSRILPAPLAGVLGAALAVTVCAQIACQPILLGLSGSVSAYAVPANLLAAPLVPFVTVPGTLAAALVPVLPGLASVILWWVAWPAAGIGWIATTVSAWPGALHAWPGQPLGAVLTILHILGALALLWLMMRWERRRAARVRRWGGVRRPRQARRTVRSVRLAWVIVAVSVGSQAAVVIPLPAGPVPADWSLAACDVGQGDMLVLRTGPSSAAVVDTGPDPQAARTCLDRLDVEVIDLLVLTHLHQDHVGGTEAVTDCCAPRRIIHSTARSPRSGTGESTGAAAAPAASAQARPGDTGRVGSGGWALSWTVVAADATAAEENDASLVLSAVLTTPTGAYTALLTGDLEEEAAARLARTGVLPEQVDVLKVSHHGARNGGVDLIRAVQPSLSVISVGQGNDYGHPHPDIVGALTRHGPVVRTDLHGTSVLSLRDGRLVPTVHPRLSGEGRSR